MEIYWRQRAKSQWACHGDRNTGFFHTVATNRKRRNMILKITNEQGEWETGEKEIRRTFINYFKALYSPLQAQQEGNVSDFFERIGSESWQSIRLEEQVGLMSIPLHEEIKDILFQMGPDQASGPDGIYARFLQHHWETVMEVVVHQIQEVFRTKKPPSD